MRTVIFIDFNTSLASPNEYALKKKNLASLENLILM